MNRIFIIFILIYTNTFFAQLKTVIGKTDYPFWIQVPEVEKTEKQPILIVLHGKSLSGTDINKVKKYGVLSAINKGRKVPGIVVAPQLASGAWNPDKVLQLLEYIQKNYNTDLNRVYVCGMSLGGYGTLHFAGKYPDKITAAVAICGGGDVKDACNLSKVPLWIQHGDNDKSVPLSESSKIVNAIKKCKEKAPCEFTIIKGGTHGSVENIFHQDKMYDWLYSKVK
jgi:predicted peptidase